MANPPTVGEGPNPRSDPGSPDRTGAKALFCLEEFCVSILADEYDKFPELLVLFVRG